MSITTVQAYIKDMNEAMEKYETCEVSDMFRKLYQLERRFSKKLKAIGGGKKVYHTFISFIRNHPDGILAARPYFREREVNYKMTVNMAIDNSKPKLLHDVPINFKFCKFAMDSLENENEQLGKIYEEIKAIREQIINSYLPLSIHNAKRHKHSSATMDFSDLVQIANEGLITAVDKYVMEEGGVEFHKMAIGRMVAYLINNSHMNLSVSIGPHANKKLYRIKRLLEKLPTNKADEMAEYIANILDSSVEEVNDLLAASSYMSLDKEFDGTDLRMVDTLAHPASDLNDPYLLVENKDLMERLSDFTSTLSILEKKILVLKGINGMMMEDQL